MKLGDFIETHYGQYAKIGTESGAKSQWIWIGDISINTLPDLNEILGKCRTRWFEILADERKKKPTQERQRSIERLESLLRMEWVPAEDREVIRLDRSVIDEAHLVYIDGYEHGGKSGFREKKQEYQIPIENYKRLAGEIVKMAASDLKSAVMTLRKSEFAYYCDMTNPRNPKTGFKFSKKHIEAEKNLIECTRFFKSDLYEIICPSISSDDVLQMTEKAVHREMMAEWREKAKLNEKRIRKNRQRNSGLGDQQ